jgi:hypothetical protein
VNSIADDDDNDPPRTDPPLSGPARLAAAVIREALAAPEPHRTLFLASKDCDFWCQVAGLRVATVRVLAARGGPLVGRASTG